MPKTKQRKIQIDDALRMMRKMQNGGSGGGGGIAEETDPTVPAWAKQPNKPSYTADEVGARPSTWTPSAKDVGADPSGTANNIVSGHNTNTAAHNDIRLLIEGLTTRLNALANSDDTTLDQMAEVVTYIKANRTLIESVTTNKVNVTDIINNLTTNVTNKPLSAAQGVVLKGLIDTLQTAVNAIKVPTKTSELTNDSEYVTDSELTAKGYAKQSEVDGLSREIADLKENGGVVTATSIKSALGYTPANQAEVDRQANALLNLEGAIIRRTKSISGYSFSSKQYRSLSIPYDVVEGYTPTVYFVACTSHSAIRVFNYYTSSGNVVFEAVNQNDTSLTVSFSIYFFYIKNVLMG